MNRRRKYQNSLFIQRHTATFKKNGDLPRRSRTIYRQRGEKGGVTWYGQVTHSQVPIVGMRLPRSDKEAEMVLFIKLDTFELKLELTTALLLTLLSVLLH